MNGHVELKMDEKKIEVIANVQDASREDLWRALDAFLRGMQVEETFIYEYIVAKRLGVLDSVAVDVGKAEKLYKGECENG